MEPDLYAREAFESIAWFVAKLVSQKYSKEENPITHGLARSDSDETVLVDTRDAEGKE